MYWKYKNEELMRNILAFRSAIMKQIDELETSQKEGFVYMQSIATYKEMLGGLNKIISKQEENKS